MREGRGKCEAILCKANTKQTYLTKILLELIYLPGPLAAYYASWWWWPGCLTRRLDLRSLEHLLSLIPCRQTGLCYVVTASGLSFFCGEHENMEVVKVSVLLWLEKWQKVNAEVKLCGLFFWFYLFFIRYFLYLHFKCYPLSWFPLWKPLVPFPLPLLTNLQTPAS